MHRIPKIFVVHKKSGGGGGGGSSSGGGDRRVKGMNYKLNSGTAGSAKPRPRLERRNALKNIDYELPSTSSFSSSEDSLSSSSSSSRAAAAGAQRTRSLDIYPLDKQTSFRIEGNDGEFEFLCKSLGFSGIEDFVIPAEEWEALKVRSSSDVFPRSSRMGNVSSYVINPKIGIDDSEAAVKDTPAACTKVIDEAICPGTRGFDFEISDSFCASPRVTGVIKRKVELNHSRFSYDATTTATSTGSDVTGQKTEVNGFGFSDTVASRCGNGSGDVFRLSDRLGDGVGVSDILSSKNHPNDLPDTRVTNVVLNANESAKVIGSNGIKGLRPPALAPPPAMSLPVIDSACSTWDILKAFAPENDRIRSDVCRAVNSDDEDGRNRDEEEDEVHCVVTNRRIGEESGLLSESCSFTTSNDDDSSSTTTEPMSNISPNGRFRCIITSWDKGELLGRGSFGSVYEGIASDGFFFAVKEVSLLDQGDEGRQSIYQLEQEIALLSQFEHENIVQYYGTDKDESKLYIFLELVTKGSLMKLYQQYHLRDSQVSNYTRQILHGLKYLHDRDVVHRDIKCANILVDASGSVKLADFGLAKAAKLNDVKSCKGTAFWMAPEVVSLRNQGYGRAADIWSLGCTVLEMLTRQFPYSHLECMQALFRIGRGEPPQVPESLSQDARDFILQCLQVNPNSRPSAAQLLNHSFVKSSLPPSGSASPYHPARRF